MLHVPYVSFRQILLHFKANHITYLHYPYVTLFSIDMYYIYYIFVCVNILHICMFILHTYCIYILYVYINRAQWIIITNIVKLRLLTPLVCCTKMEETHARMQNNEIYWTCSGLRTVSLYSSQQHQAHLAMNSGTENAVTPSAVPHLLTSIMHIHTAVITEVCRPGCIVKSKSTGSPRKQGEN